LKFVVKILLGLVIFNAMLIILGPIFPSSATTLGSDAVDPEDITSPTGAEGDDIPEPGKKYSEISDMGDILKNMFLNPTTVLIIGVIVGASLLTNFLTRGTVNVPLALGIGLFVGIIVSLWINTSNIIYNIDPTDSPYITGLIAVTTVGIGIIIVFMVSDKLSGTQEAY
jgi:hypothetical protein